MVNHLARHASVHHKILPGDEASLGGNQVSHQCSDVFGPANAAGRMLLVIRF